MATALRPACLYSPYVYSDQYLAKAAYNVSSDCLYLNIYTPSLPHDPVKTSRTDKLLYGTSSFVIFFTVGL